MASESRKPARANPSRTMTRARRLLQLVEVWWDEQLCKARAAAERGLTALLVYILLVVLAASLLVAAAGHLVGGLARALSAAWDGPAWTGDVAVGLLVPAIVIGLVLRAHRRRARQRDAQPRDED